MAPTPPPPPPPETPDNFAPTPVPEEPDEPEAPEKPAPVPEATDEEEPEAIAETEEEEAVEEKLILEADEPDPSSRPIIFYPGGLVAPEVYLYKMGMVASKVCTTVFTIKAPFNAAIFNTNAADAIITHHQ